jgi:diacylglycerol kinase
LTTFLSDDSAPIDGFTNKDKSEQVKLAVTKPLVPFSWRVKASGSTSLVESFYHAFAGIGSALHSERNLRIHAVAAVLTIACGIWLKINATDWMAITLAIGMVFTAEFLNTAVEHMVDLTTGRTYFEAAKAAKDTAAAAVLIASIVALTIGVVIFVPRITALFA